MILPHCTFCCVLCLCHSLWFNEIKISFSCFDQFFISLFYFSYSLTTLVLIMFFIIVRCSQNLFSYFWEFSIQMCKCVCIYAFIVLHIQNNAFSDLYMHIYTHICTYLHIFYYMKIPYYKTIVPIICIQQHSMDTRVHFLQLVRLWVKFIS